MSIPVLTEQQRRAWPLLALALDCYREPEPGEDYIDLRTPAATRHGKSGRAVHGPAPVRTAMQRSSRNKAASKDRESLEAKTATAARK
jgi:hypothetical protein